MAIVRLVLTKPLNVSLQAKASDVSSTTANIDNGAWDIVYFTRMEGGKQIGDVQRLGKCINIETAEGDYYSEELVTNGDFANGTSWDVTAAGWNIGNGVAEYSGASFGFIEQTGLNIIAGKTYTITFINTTSAGNPLIVYLGGTYTNPQQHIITTGTQTIEMVAGSTDSSLKFGAGIIVEMWNGTIDNVSVKRGEVHCHPNYNNSNQYLVDVEVDSTAQTPIEDDYIFFGKENKVCISGIRGYYAEVEMKNDSTEKAELFSVGSEMTHSSK